MLCSPCFTLIRSYPEEEKEAQFCEKYNLEKMMRIEINVLITSAKSLNTLSLLSEDGALEDDSLFIDFQRE